MTCLPPPGKYVNSGERACAPTTRSLRSSRGVCPKLYNQVLPSLHQVIALKAGQNTKTRRCCAVLCCVRETQHAKMDNMHATIRCRAALRHTNRPAPLAGLSLPSNNKHTSNTASAKTKRNETDLATDRSSYHVLIVCALVGSR